MVFIAFVNLAETGRNLDLVKMMQFNGLSFNFLQRGDFYGR